jgi:zinc protease
VTVKAPAEQPYVIMVFRAPTLRDPERDWEPYALEMLGAVLDGNPAARLTRNLVRVERLASSADASYDPARARVFLPQRDRLPGNPRRRKQGLRREMGKIINDGVGSGRTDRAQAQAVAARISDSMTGARDRIDGRRLAQDHRPVLRKLREVTPSRCGGRAQHCRGCATIAYLDPQPLETKAAARRRVSAMRSETK